MTSQDILFPIQSNIGSSVYYTYIQFEMKSNMNQKNKMRFATKSLEQGIYVKRNQTHKMNPDVLSKKHLQKRQLPFPLKFACQ